MAIIATIASLGTVIIFVGFSIFMITQLVKGE
ncbi:hypothetical protein Galf_0593 [Gallionella capsiferriformans ES-2]|jgi:hypothetical protein|uniref:Uncharacterized protein n=1 Tax=Gallionella capsiferriformans (strain ES-2) TaxID=395494 RepID=D9SCU6_GALCS|nr:hypothetical protein Galf_0593 [Gallionella capsiferriformans ES-2]